MPQLSATIGGSRQPGAFVLSGSVRQRTVLTPTPGHTHPLQDPDRRKTGGSRNRRLAAKAAGCSRLQRPYTGASEGATRKNCVRGRCRLVARASCINR
eukprot:7656791-Pyramimonas_sp.AAC.1